MYTSPSLYDIAVIYLWLGVTPVHATSKHIIIISVSSRQVVTIRNNFLFSANVQSANKHLFTAVSD